MNTPIVNGNIASLILLAGMGVVIGACVHSLYFRILLDLGLDPTEKHGARLIVRRLLNKLKEEYND